MSTRATYRFFRDETSVTYYIHHDGYPEGAAAYFNAAQVWAKKYSEKIVDAFIRANDRAEHTESHEIHGDTEYRYDLIQNWNGRRIQMIAHERQNGEWVEFFSGEMMDFVKKYRPDLAEGKERTC